MPADGFRTGRLNGADDVARVLRAAAARHAAEIRDCLVLNPVENFPFPEDLAIVSGPLHGLYNSDKPRSREQRVATDHQFAGRADIERDCRIAHSAWATALGGADATLRVLSGLHAHVVLFMSIARPGQRVLLLPVRAGGHVSERQILERLGLEVVEMVPDDARMCVDMDATLALYDQTRPDFVVVDRSEGLVVEDFSPLTGGSAVTVFDASQYLTHVLTDDHPNPFAAGFDLVVSTVHKNFPGPQKALLATRDVDETWRLLLSGLSMYVSNMHVASTYAATLTLGRAEWLAEYSKRMLACAVQLEELLVELEVPAVSRPRDRLPTHHVWIREGSREKAFATFEAFEQCGILTNYRKLPYGLGHGVRLGLSAATRMGLQERDVPELAQLLAYIRHRGPTPGIMSAARAFNRRIWEQGAAER